MRRCIKWIYDDFYKPSYKDPPKEISYFAYKRINHFKYFSDSKKIVILFLINKTN